MSDSKIFSALQRHSETVEQATADCADSLERYAAHLAQAFAADQRLLLLGDGVFSHVAAITATALVHRLNYERPSLPAVAPGDAGLLAAMSAAGEVDNYFAALIKAHAASGDCVCLLAQGENAAMGNAVTAAQEIGCHTAVFACGDGRGWQQHQADIMLSVRSNAPAQQCEALVFLGHLLCELLEAELFGF